MMNYSWLTKLKGFYFFPIIGFEIGVLLCFGVNYYLVFGLLLLFIRLVFGKKKILTYLSFSAIFIGLVFCILFSYFDKKIEIPAEILNVDVQMDTIKISGDYLSFIGKELSTRQKVKCSYYLKTEEEKQYFEKCQNQIVLRCKFETQKIEETRNLHGFNQQHFFASQGIKNKLKINHIDAISNREINMLTHPVKSLQLLRRKGILCCEKIKAPLTRYYTNIFLFGYKSEEAGLEIKQWAHLGLIHIFSLSGMHLYFFLKVFRYCILRVGISHETEKILEYFCLLFFVVMSGFAIGIVRASLLTGVKQVNRKKNLRLSQSDCWSLTLGLHTLINPRVLLTVGGQFSYYLSFIIVMVCFNQSRQEKRWRENFKLNVILSFLSLPLIWYYFYEWHLLSMVGSFILLPIFLTGVLPAVTAHFFIFVTTGLDVSLILDFFLQPIQTLGLIATKIPCLHFVVGKPPDLLMLVMISLQWWILYRIIVGYTQKSLVLFAVIVFFSLSGFKYYNPFGIVTSVDVGQADAMLIVEPFHHRVYVVDVGGRREYEKDHWRQPKIKFEDADKALIPFLKSQGVSKIDNLFITHAHEDHCGNLQQIGQAFTIKELVTTEGTLCAQSFKPYLKGFEHCQKTWRKGAQIKSCFGTMQCLYPMKKGDGGNDDSLVLKYSFGSQSLLLMGDLEVAGEQTLLQHTSPELLKCDILKSGHHGSKTSSTADFIEVASPDYAWISCGLQNRYGHPSPETLRTYLDYQIQTYRTDNQGMIYLKWLGFGEIKFKIQTIK